VHELNWFDAREVGDVLHDKTVMSPLRAYPLGRFQSKVAVDAIKELPGVGHMALINIKALCVSGLAEDRPGNSCLEL
jgi:hypothetical protein